MKKSKIYFLSGLFSQDGFSLVELLIVLGLIGLMGTFVSSVYLFTQRSVNQWQRNIELQNDLHTLIHGITEDIYRAEFLTAINKHGLTLEMPDTKRRKYELRAGKLFRNERPLNKPGIKVEKLVFKWRKSLEDYAGTISLDEISFIRVELMLVDKEDTLSSHRMVYLRNPSIWKPINEK